MLITLGVIATGIALAPPEAYPGSVAPVTPVRTAGDVVDLRQQLIETDLGSNGYQLLDGPLSEESIRNRARLGADENAPHTIYVRALDGVFAIDPFVAVEQLVPRPVYGEFSFNRRNDVGETLRVQRQVFGEFSLNTDRALFNWDRVEATAELMRTLESARLDWLRSNGYFGARTIRNPGASAEASAARERPEPKAIFRLPPDMPRTQPREEVRETAPARTDIGRAMASAGEATRISLPSFQEPSVRISMPARDETPTIVSR